MMDSYRPYDVTARARQIAKEPLAPTLTLPLTQTLTLTLTLALTLALTPIRTWSA